MLPEERSDLLGGCLDGIHYCWNMRSQTRLLIVLFLVASLTVMCVVNHNYEQELNVVDDPNTAEALHRSADKSSEQCDPTTTDCQPHVQQQQAQNDEELGSDMDTSSPMHLAVVACGDRLEETLTMIKSATLLTSRFTVIHIFADEDLKPQFAEQLSQWPEDKRKLFEVRLHDIEFPSVTSPDLWKKLFKPCACQRLFLPDLLEDVDRLIYVDTDVLFFVPLEELWAFFDDFNSTHIAAVTNEHEEGFQGWYNRFARHPYYGQYGINSGVMLMHLELMRQNKWLPRMKEHFEIYRLNTTWGDQDLINIFFSFCPEKLHIIPCEWNYRPDHCMYGDTCKSSNEAGVKVVHGNRGVYHNEKRPTFKAIYQTIKEYK